MFNNFSLRHPWFTRVIKSKLWNILNFFGVRYLNFNLANTNQKFRIYLQDVSVGKHIFIGNYEKDTINFFSKFLESGNVVFDIGANTGYFTLLFSFYVGETGEVHCFEPSKREFFNLCTNLQKNEVKNININNIAVTNQNGYARMNILDDERYGAFNSLGNPIRHPKIDVAERHHEVVRTIKIDSYLELFPDLIPTLVKIDVEGFEIPVLNGMKKLLTSPNAPCLIIEICENTHKDLLNKPNDVIQCIKSYGYLLFSIDTNGNLLPFIIGESLNAVAIKKHHIYQLKNAGIIFDSSLQSS